MCRASGKTQTIGVIAHRLCRLIWKILYQGVRYEERGPAVRKKSERYRAARMIREIHSIGYRVELASSPSAVPAQGIFDHGSKSSRYNLSSRSKSLATIASSNRGDGPFLGNSLICPEHNDTRIDPPEDSV
jgi:hypothetical protein